MALDKQVVNLPMTGGLQEVAHEKLLDLPFMQTIQNGVYRKDGAISKRYGSTVLGTTGLPSTLDPNSIFSHNGALAQHTPFGAYELSEDNTKWRQTSVAGVRPCEVFTREVNREGNTINYDSAVLGNMACYVWEVVGGGCWASVVELDTGAFICPPTELPSQILHLPKVVGFDNTFIIAAHSSTTLPAPVYAARMSVVSLPVTFPTTTTRIDGTNNVDLFDCHVATVSDTVVHFAMSIGGGNTLLAAYNKSLTLVDSETIAKDSDTSIACHWSAATARLFVGTRAGVTANVLVHYVPFAAGAYGAPVLDTFSDAPLNTGAGSVDLGLMIAERTSSGALQLVSCTATADPGVRSVTCWALDSAGVFIAASEFSKEGYELATRGFRPLDWEVCVFGIVSSNFTDRVILMVTPYAASYGSGQSAVDVLALAPIARVHQDVASRRPDVVDRLRHFPTVVPWTLSGHTKYLFAKAIVAQYRTFGLNASVATSRLGGNYVLLDLTPKPLRQGKCNSVSVFNGGFCSAYDGIQSFENTPHNVVGPVVADNGAGSLSGQFRYASLFYYEDRNGNIHRGPVDTNTGSITVVNKQISYYIPYWPVSALDRQYGCRIRAAVYRTTDLATDPDSLYYLIKDNITEQTGILNDVEPDASIITGPQVYTTGDVLDSDPAPALIDMVTTKSRAFGISSEQPNLIWYTKPFSEFVAPEWNGTLTLHIPDEGGECVALGALDDKIIVFKERSIYFFFGEGPNAIGEDGSFSDVRPISTDTGCLNRSSVVQGPFGLMFQAERGFYILGRDLGLKYIPNVEDLTQDIDINAAVVIPLYHEIRFTADDGEALSYNYLFDRWSTFTDYDSIHACLWEDVYVRLQDDYRVFKESSGDYTDDSVGYTLLIETPWIKIHGLQGFQRIWWAKFLGEHLAQSFQAEVGFNYDEDYPVTKTWTSAQIGALARFQVGIHIPSGRQKCQAIRFRFTDYGTPSPPEQPHPVSTGAGYTLAGLALEVGLKKGSFKHLPDGAKK